MQSRAQIDKTLGSFEQSSEQIWGEHVDGEDVLEPIHRLDSAFAFTDSRVVNDRVVWPQPVGLISQLARLRDACQVPNHNALCLGRLGLRVPGTTLVAGMEDDLVAGGNQSLGGPQAETVRRPSDQYLAHVTSRD